ncbi:MAG TPA: outer membrane beta-barrel protein [Steroidobacteraceae bacterium]|nr:outer membrane beta-barrel protein [Steroidobacteraceae bacterium]
MRRLLLIPLLALAAGSAHAAGLFGAGLYAGAGLMRANVNDLFGSGFDIHNTSFKALAGLRLSLLGAEVDYYHLGSESRSFDNLGNVEAHARAFAAYAVGYLPIPLPLIDIYGKLGLDRWQLSGSSASPSLFRLSDNGTQLAWGVGAQAHFGSLIGRLEYEHLNISNTDGAHVVSLDVIFNFL